LEFGHFFEESVTGIVSNAGGNKRMDTAFIFPTGDGSSGNAKKRGSSVDCKKITGTGNGIVFNGVKYLKIKE